MKTPESANRLSVQASISQRLSSNPIHPSSDPVRAMKNIEVDVDVEMKSIQLQEPSADVPSPTGDVTPAGQKGKENGQRRRAHIQFATLCWSLYLAGWNDGTTGPLLPRIQRVYSVNFAVVSLLFVFACIGFMTGALSNLVLDGRYGFGKVAAVFPSSPYKLTPLHRLSY